MLGREGWARGDVTAHYTAQRVQTAHSPQRHARQVTSPEGRPDHHHSARRRPARHRPENVCNATRAEVAMLVRLITATSTTQHCTRVNACLGHSHPSPDTHHRVSPTPSFHPRHGSFRSSYRRRGRQNVVAINQQLA